VTPPPSVPVDELVGANVPDWLNLAVFDRWGRVAARQPRPHPGVGLMREWSIDESKLPGLYRRALDVIAALGPAPGPTPSSPTA
jgi:hypothetical protein